MSASNGISKCWWKNQSEQDLRRSVMAPTCEGNNCGSQYIFPNEYKSSEFGNETKWYIHPLIHAPDEGGYTKCSACVHQLEVYFCWYMNSLQTWYIHRGFEVYTIVRSAPTCRGGGTREEEVGKQKLLREMRIYIGSSSNTAQSE